MVVTNLIQVNLLLELLEDIKNNLETYYNMNKHRLQILYQKTDFNSSRICQFNSIFKCCKCKKNNTVMVEPNKLVQLCLFCGTPNYVKK